MTHALKSTSRSVLSHRDQVDILMVDDRPENLLALEAILEPLNQRLVRAHSGEEALRMLLQHDFAVVLLDVQMPGMNGFETAQIIKSRERTRYIPIIFLTAISKEEDYVFRGYQMGAVDYISKPFQPDVLRAKVMVFVDLHLKQKRLAEQESMLREGERRMTELRHMREMVAQEARFKEIVSTAMDAIVIFGEDEKISVFNNAAERMFGRSAAKMQGEKITTLFDGENAALNVRDFCAEAQKAHGDRSSNGSGAQHVASLLGRRNDATTFPAEASISCFEGKEGLQYTLIVRDISERIRQEEELKRQATILEQTTAELQMANEELSSRQQDLERAMTARSRFYASMSHELRTPINAIIGYNTLLLDHIYGPLNEKQTHGLQRTHKAANHLLELVNDVLDLSKIEAGKIELTLQPVPFPGIIEDLFVTVRPLADEHETSLELRVHGSPKSIISDPRRVRQILLNLLSNAIKFGRGKPILVEASLGASDHIEMAVTDQGAGIDPDDLPRIFDEFVQLSNSQQLGGTGLGLPISKRLATLLGGELRVSSEKGKGSTFCLTLPERIGMDDD